MADARKVEILPRVVKKALGDVRVEIANDLATGRSIATQCKNLQMIVLDLLLPDAHGTTSIGVLTKEHARVPVVVISAIDDRHTARECLDAGAAGYLPKSSKIEVIAAALRVIAAGSRFVPPEMLDGSRDYENEYDARLTQRQKQVLDLALRGLTNAQIAAELSISGNTVKQHLRAIYGTFGISNRTELEQKLGNLATISTTKPRSE